MVLTVDPTSDIIDDIIDILTDTIPDDDVIDWLDNEYAGFCDEENRPDRDLITPAETVLEGIEILKKLDIITLQKFWVYMFGYIR